MTEKLYYADAYIKEFSATVKEVVPKESGFLTVLDRTAFFPEEGGQSSDRGYIGSARVTDVREEGGVIYHLTDAPLSVGDEVLCKIDFDERFEKMQCHTAEHVLCGIIHRIYGYENVGFHLGDEEVVFDVSAPMTREELEEVFSEANKVVYENRPVFARFPEREELATLVYRSKLELLENVRIVDIDGVDSCACCAPHVSYTGEIGSIALIDFQKHRGGTRIFMLAGRRAERDYNARREVARRISSMTSEPQRTIDEAVERLLGEFEALRQDLKIARQTEAELRARLLDATEGNAVVLISDFSIPELIAFSNVAGEKVGGILVALSGTEGDYKYVISSKTQNLRLMAKDINTALGGRGGGRPEMIQGSFCATLFDIEKYFA